MNYTTKFKNIAVIPNEQKDPTLKHTKNLIDYLVAYGGNTNNICNIWMAESYRQKLGDYALNYADDETLYQSCDLLIALGGDATMLGVAAKASRFAKPVIGVNLGRVGYMSEIEPDEMHLFEQIFSGDFRVHERMMIDVVIIKSDGIAHQAGTALNDAVITNGVMARLIEIDLFADNVKITHYRADGVIIATPTGSTAYSMSAGGPIIDPNIECICVTPICPHSLSSKPVIFSHDSTLEVRRNDSRDRHDTDVYLTVDGRTNVKLERDDVVRLTKSNFTAKLISVKNHGFFDVIREKISES